MTRLISIDIKAWQKLKDMKLHKADPLADVINRILNLPPRNVRRGRPPTKKPAS